MRYITFRKLKSTNSDAISQLLLNSPSFYTKYFYPFDFQTSSIKNILEKANRDIFFGIELISESSAELIGFYMLRGLDEGYAHPMYGVFISYQYRGKGIASLTISHAECFCKLKGYKRLLLKVDPENIKAKKLYESLGFRFLREDLLNKNLILYKDI